MTTKHTPAPWSVTKNEPIWGHQGKAVGRIIHIEGPAFCDSRLGNAIDDHNLIEAVPVMYVALKEVVKTQEDQVVALGWSSVDEYRKWHQESEAYTKAREAIAKVEKGHEATTLPYTVILEGDDGLDSYLAHVDVPATLAESERKQAAIELAFQECATDRDQDIEDTRYELSVNVVIKGHHSVE